ncbi:type I polyketide synthase [Streptomyces ochraceiscleroticus]|uniref:Type I polyketide synthase n=1 Tax=Streptomyces ochraceiscleroticus TaxID=47761 RepID=A0ABW1MMU0_9ACTN|nr:type I polyketide synthase [Streptomyces ochraceiscleroticus]
MQTRSGPQSSEIDRRLARDPLAIVGLAGKFPKASDVREFWDNIVAARDCSDVVPESWWSTEHYYDPNPFTEDKTYCRRGGFLTPEIFDPREFGMPPNTVDSTGLVQLLSLVVAKETLHDAGCGRGDWYDPARTGVVLGVCGTNSTLIPLAARLLVPQVAETMVALGVPEEKARQVLQTRLAALPGWTEDSFPGILGNVVSGRVANRLNLGAANHTVDAACASSLTALRSAADELLSRRADLMLTGGCDADNSIVSFMCFSKTPALSFTSQVRPFDAEADGTLVGEGIGMLALKRLEDATQHGDRIYAVLRGLGSSSDGRAQSIYAPCGNGQLTALRRAYEDADCAPQSVELIEAHGTGTPTGDQVELSSLNTLLATPDEHHYAAVGSVKSQIGHAKAAAGVAGLIKTTLALHHKVLPPTINVDSPSPESLREDSALYVNTAARPWVRDASRPVRRAGVSAFGFGGVNYHAVLEEAPPGAGQQEYALHRTPRACLWHAADAQELQQMLERRDPPSTDPAPEASARIGFVATDEQQYEELLALAVEKLRSDLGKESWSHPRGVHYRRAGLPADTRAGALFAGQGSQYVEMGLHAAMGLPPVRAAFDTANALFPSADSLARAVFPPLGTGDPQAHSARLRRTSYAQSAIGALSMGQYRYLRELGFAPHGLLGHSFGELTALWAAGVLDDESFTALARARGQAMEQPPGEGTDPGAMAAVRGPADALTEALREHPDLALCNRNAPDDHTVGGPTAAVRRFVEWCADRDLTVRELPVAAAFHTAHVGHAAEAFGAACAEVDFGPPDLPVHANTTGAAYGQDAAHNRRTLVQQLQQPVDFAAGVEAMYADGIRVFVEFGPGRTLTGLVERILGDRDGQLISCDAGPGKDSCAALKDAAVRLAVLGLPLSGIDRYDAPPRAQRPAPSTVARALEGPLFAVEKLRPIYEKRLAEAAAEARQEQLLSPQPGLLPAPAAAVHDQEADPLTRAAAEHLAAHTRYLDGQLRTAEQLTGLLREGTSGGRVEDSLAAAVHAVTEHSLALGEAHTKAGQVVTDLLRMPGDAQPLPPYDALDGDTPADQDGRLPVIPHQAGHAPAAPPTENNDQPAPPVGTSALAELWATGGATEPQATMDVGAVDPDELERVFRAVVAEKTGYDIDMIEPDMYIQEDLGIDSLKQVEIGAEMWRRYPVIGRSEMYRFSEAKTVRELTKLLEDVITGPAKPQLQPGRQDAHAGHVYVGLRELPAIDACTAAYGEKPHALIIDDGGELATVLSQSLASQGWQTCRVLLPAGGPSDQEDQAADNGEQEPGLWCLEDWEEETLDACLRGIQANSPRIDLCVLPVSRSAPGDANRAVERLRHAVLMAKHVRPALEDAAQAGTRAGLVAVTQLDGALGYAGAGGDTTAALAGGLGGLVKSFALEATTVFCRALDFAPEMPDQEVADAFTTEIADLATDVREVALHGTVRRTPHLSATPSSLLPAPRQPAELTEQDVVVVTGGAAGITAWCVEELARTYPCRYLLLGRTPLEDEPAWAAHLDSEEALRRALEDQAGEAGEDPTAEAARSRIEKRTRQLVHQRGIRSTLEALRAHGAQAEYLSADVRDAAAVATALAPYADCITGVLHGAGILRDRSLNEATPESIAAVVDTKLAGLSNVLNALHPDRLRHLLLFSSVAGIWGNVRQTDYALANESLNRFGCAFQAAHPDCRVMPIAWGPWSGGMAAAVQQVFTDAGVPVLSREEGCAHLLTELANRDGGGSAVAVIGPTAPLYHRIERLPDQGLTAHRMLTGLEDEPVLRDHCFFEHAPTLPMTAAIGWALHTIERAHGGGRPVVEARDFRITHGITFPGGHEERFRVRLAPEPTTGGTPGTGSVRLIVHDTGQRQKQRFEGCFRQAEQAPEAPRTDVPPPPYTLDEALHPGYTDGRLFHGPSLAGLRNVLQDQDNRLVIAARMPDPGLANGAYAGQLYSPALADLLLQVALLALLKRTETRDIPLPVSIERLELFSPLPDDGEFVITVDVQDDDVATPFFTRCTLTASSPEGRIHQRWTGVHMLWISPTYLANGIAGQANVVDSIQG